LKFSNCVLLIFISIARDNEFIIIIIIIIVSLGTIIGLFVDEKHSLVLMGSEYGSILIFAINPLKQKSYTSKQLPLPILSKLPPCDENDLANLEMIMEDDYKELKLASEVVMRMCQTLLNCEKYFQHELVIYIFLTKKKMSCVICACVVDTCRGHGYDDCIIKWKTQI
jgi:hypothetical protein